MNVVVININPVFVGFAVRALLVLRLDTSRLLLILLSIPILFVLFLFKFNVLNPVKTNKLPACVENFNKVDKIKIKSYLIIILSI